VIRRVEIFGEWLASSNWMIQKLFVVLPGVVFAATGMLLGTEIISTLVVAIFLVLVSSSFVAAFNRNLTQKHNQQIELTMEYVKRMTNENQS
jgi:hypothetical protein